MADHRQLDVWKAGRRIVLLAYRVAAELSDDERFGLRPQIQRVAVSIPANLADGIGRRSNREFARSVRVAIGSANELDTLLTLLIDLRLVEESSLDVVSAELRDLAVRLRNLANRLEEGFVGEEIVLYDDAPPSPSATDDDRPQA